MVPFGEAHRPLEGRVAVVTGASSGIGRATAMRLASLGAEIVVGARRSDRLVELCGAIGEHGGVADAFPLDVADPSSAEAFVRAVRARRGVDILINNAGLARGFEPVAEGSESDWREMIEANVMGLMRMTRLFLPSLLERPQGDIVHVGSVAGLQPYASGAAYCASKAAVEAFAQALRLELLGTNIRQLVIEPGLVGDTEFSEVRFHGDRERAQAVYRGVTPLSAVDVAECIAFAVTRPAHVCIQTLLLMPTAQAAVTAIARRED
jgi:NADP-dependent 3-hydroxy acid dehydrogenase YdfG